MGACGSDENISKPRVERIVAEVPPLALEPTRELVEFFGDKLNTKYIRVSEKIHEAMKKHGLYRFKDSAANLLGTDKLAVHSASNSQVQYHGQAQGQKFHGKGHFVDKEGNLFISPFVNGFSNGVGAVYFADGAYFFGDLEANDLENGKMVYPDGTVYIGEFRNKQRNGRGSYVYPDGTKYEGDWLNDKEHGNGRLVIEGVWDSGRKVTATPASLIPKAPASEKSPPQPITSPSGPQKSDPQSFKIPPK